MKKFKVSFEGIYAAMQDKSIQIQLFLAFCTVIAAIILQFSRIEWCIIVLCIVMVIAAEMFNTCIERICDFIQPEQDARIKFIKDVSSGAVLVLSLGALIIGIMLVLSKL